MKILKFLFFKRTNKGRRVLRSTGEKDIVVFEMNTLSSFEMCADYRIGHLRMLPNFSKVGVAELCVYG